jgi:hypothetical protein
MYGFFLVWWLGWALDRHALNILGLKPLVPPLGLFRCLEMLAAEFGKEAIPRFTRKFRVLGQFAHDTDSAPLDQHITLR